MSINIAIEEDCQISTFNFGAVNKKYEFMVTTTYDTRLDKLSVDNIIWTDLEPPKLSKTEMKIKELAMKINAK